MGNYNKLKKIKSLRLKLSMLTTSCLILIFTISFLILGFKNYDSSVAQAENLAKAQGQSLAKEVEKFYDKNLQSTLDAKSSIDNMVQTNKLKVVKMLLMFLNVL